MRALRFSSNRHSPIASTEQEVLSWLGRLKSALDVSSRPELAEPLLLFDLSEDEVSFPLPESSMKEAAELKTSEPELLRQLRYAFRDWRVAVREEIERLENSSEPGLKTEQLAPLLEAENATLFAVKNEGVFQWACCLGFRFNRHADNHLSPLAGSFIPESESIPESPAKETITDSAPSKQASHQPLNTYSNSRQSIPVASATAWWHGKEHQAVLIFSCGFLLAAIFGTLFLRSNTCNTSDLERQIADMQVQVDQRCSAPQP